jgi:large subunit ribosomal protein L22
MTAIKEGHISQATARNVRVPPRKARLVVDLVRGKDVGIALDVLTCCEKKTAAILKKLLLSAAANAQNKSDVDLDSLYVKRAWVNEGTTLKRFLPRAQGRATPLRKRHSTITVILDEVAAR